MAQRRKRPRNSLSGTTDPWAQPPATGNGVEYCLVVHPHLKARGRRARTPEASLEEAVGLAQAIDLTVVHTEVVPVTRRRPATLLGSGTVARLGDLIAGGTPGNGRGDGAETGTGTRRIDVAVVDAVLTPVQQRNLEREWNCKVIDRNGLILEIFGERARTREGRLQVELAALTYQRSRLVRSWTHLERQRGGFGFMGGPGETQIEADRRMIGRRITRLTKELTAVKRTRKLHRQARQRVANPVVALVGYTNAGKSTLFNTLTDARVPARDQLFATLDPTMRAADLPSGRTVILSDTVGFISDLPHELVTAFHATLEEVCEADVIVHVRDAAHADTEAQKDDVHGVLRDMGLGDAVDRTLIEVLNKIDLLAPEEREILANRARRANRTLVPLSALTGEGCPVLLAVLDDRLSGASRLLDIAVAHDDGAALAWLYDHGDVVERTDDERFVHVKVRLDAADAARFARRRERSPH